MNFKIFKGLDWVLAVVVAILFLIGMVVISSATHVNDYGSTRQLMMQGVSFILGISILFGTLFIDYNTFQRYEKQLYIFNIILLLIVYIPGLGVQRGGAHSWINLGPIDFQTTELVKLTFILGFASFLERRQGRFKTFKDLIPIALYSAPILFLVLIQPDLGGVIVFVSIIFGMVFVSGLNPKLIGYGFGAFIVSVPIIYRFLKPHQRVRIDAFLNPGDPKYEGNFQVIQSMIAIGSGKIFGKGLYKGTQNQYNFLPVQESDFIFAVLGEEFGLVGMVFVVFLFYIFVSRILKIAANAKDTYGTLITIGVLFMFLYQIVQNIGMAIGVMPVTGVTLPFVSYGASSLLMSMMGIAIVLNVSMRTKKIKF